MEIFTARGVRILIDDEDFDKANRGKSLFVKSNGFVVISKRTSRTSGKHIYLHKEIMGVGKGVHVDHINHDRLDNRKSNLRICTHAENQRNKNKRVDSQFKYKGVRRYGRSKRWHAFITVNRVSYRSELLATEEEAALAYNELAKKYHGEFARLNEI
jgi:hypothetical protein